jgi:hypothetical protein
VVAGGGAAVTLGLGDLAFVGSLGPVGPTDPHFASVSLLLRGQGSNDSTTIADNSPRQKTVTALGGAKIITSVADPFGFTDGVISLDGFNDHLRIGNNADFTLDGDFTLEFWFYQFSASVKSVIAYSPALTTGLAFGPSSTLNRLWFWNGTARITSPLSYSVNTWTYGATVRSGPTVSMWQNGQAVGSYTESKTFTPNADIFIGGDEFNQWFNGYLSNVRITKGVARNVSVIPSLPFPIA